MTSKISLFILPFTSKISLFILPFTSKISLFILPFTSKISLFVAQHNNTHIYSLRFRRNTILRIWGIFYGRKLADIGKFWYLCIIF